MFMKRRMSWLVTMTIILVVGVIVFYYFTNKANDSDNGTNANVVGEVDKVLNKDLKSRYPYTVKEVVQFFVRIQKCYYNEEYTEDELLKLADKARELFDDELLSENSVETYYENLKNEVKAYQSIGKTIYRVIIEENNDVVYSTVDGQKYASINCTYYLKDEEGTTSIKETYILRKDENDRWKILGWEKYEGSEWEQ